MSEVVHLNGCNHVTIKISHIIQQIQILKLKTMVTCLQTFVPYIMKKTVEFHYIVSQ